MLALPQAPHGATPAEFQALVSAYHSLFGARGQPRRKGRDPDTNPLRREHLGSTQIDDRLLLWMLYQAHVVHLRLVPGSPRNERRFKPANSLLLGENSYFALTPEGEVFAKSLLGDPDQHNAAFHQAAGEQILLGRLVPHFAAQDRIFSGGRHELKCFRQPAGNQVIVLCTAEELGWPTWFDDPLTRGPKKNPKVRLHDTIKDLNRHQRPHLIHFKGNGTGTQIGWEYR